MRHTNLPQSVITLAIIFMVASWLFSARVSAEVIHVNTNNDLNNLGNTIANAIEDGEKDIDVVFASKTFTYRENLINFSNKQWAGVNLRLTGNGATLQATGPILTNGASYKRTFQPNYTYIASNNSVLSPWGELRATDRLIEVVDEGQKLCRLHWSEAKDMPTSDCGNTWIHISQWYTSAVYKVVRIDSGWIYFTVSNLSYNTARQSYNVNADYGYAKTMPRFRLCNSGSALSTMTDSAGGISSPAINVSNGIINLPDTVSSVRECQATHFLQIKNTTLSSLSIDGLTFAGNKESANYLITLASVLADSIAIRSCFFIGLGSGAICAQQTDNLAISNCSFRDCRRNGIYVEGGTGARITQNSFKRMGLALLNSFCIRVSGTDFLISGNKISDFGYGGIAVGTWWATPKTFTVSGTVEQNTIFYSPEWLSNIMGHSLMDSGAIYLYTQMDNVRVRHNFIHDYTGAYDNRGIFCDDGAKNFTIEGNIILHTPNSFSIDARRTISIETNPRSHTDEVNVNNTIAYNIIDGSIRFEGRNNNANCTLGRNIFLRQRTDSAQTNVLAYLSTSTPFTVAAYQGLSNGLVRVPSTTLRLIRALPSWPYLRQFFATE